MARALSNPEWAQFYADNSDLIFSLQPGQSKVVSWNGESVLVFIGAGTVTVNDQIYPDVYLSDVTDAPQLQAISTAGYGTAAPQSALDALPQAVIDTIKEDAAAVGALADKAGQALTDAAKLAADAAKKAAEEAQTIIIGAVAILGLLFLLK